MLMSDFDYQDIIQYWFDEKTKPQWFNSTLLFDAELKERFEAVYIAATQDELNHWLEDAEGALALIIVLDQFPLNFYRGDARSFLTEEKSRLVAEAAMKKGFDKLLTDEQKAFLYMPFMHSENLDDQDHSVALYEKAGLQGNVTFAHHHRSIIARFGRFPHRNVILGRENSEAEKNYLVSGEAFLG